MTETAPGPSRGKSFQPMFYKTMHATETSRPGKPGECLAILAPWGAVAHRLSERTFACYKFNSC